MKILLASSEVYPYSKTGGLADMVGALAKTLGLAGHKVGLVTPLYLGIREQFPDLNLLDMPLDFPLGTQRFRGEVWCLEPSPGLTLYFVDQPGFYQRSSLYQKYGTDYPDNAERFLFLSKAVAHLALHLPWKPEVLHLNDWQTAMAALFIEHQRRLSGWESAPRTILTIHNMAYQGVFPAGHYAMTNLPWDYFNPNGVEFYGKINFLKAGIAYSGIITTVSPRYAREITTEEFGAGLDGLLRSRQKSLFGILNGVDYAEWNPSADPYVKHSFSAEDLDGKTAIKLELQKDFGLATDASVPLFANIGRLVHQKGVDILLGALEEMLSTNLQFILLGTGDPMFQKAFQDLARRHPSRAAVHIGYNESMSHHIEAGCDFFLMPSRFEPCGLNQMYSLRYASIPIVRVTGGLDDTVIDIKDNPEHANGIKFVEYTSGALAKSIRKALALYETPELFRHYRQNAITRDFSWDRTAVEYVGIYRKAAEQND